MLYRWIFFKHLLRKIQILLKSGKNIEQYTRANMYVTLCLERMECTAKVFSNKFIYQNLPQM